MSNESETNLARAPYILGLDIGVNSIGWAVVDCESSNGGLIPIGLRALNSFIFTSAVEAKKEVPLNAKRRQHRLMRRQTKRRKKRRLELMHILKSSSMLPQLWNEQTANDIDRSFVERIIEEANPRNLQFFPISVVEVEDRISFASNPFAMRCWGLDNKIELYELGRIFMQMQKQRGFRSNRGAKYLELIRKLNLKEDDVKSEKAKEEDLGEEKKEDTGIILKGIKELINEMESCKSRTLGEFIWQQAIKIPELPRKITKYVKDFTQSTSHNADKKVKIGFYAKREMIEIEFEKLWNIQQQYHDNHLSKSLKDNIKGVLFKQMPVQSPPPPKKRLRHLRYNAVGNCSILPREKRAAKALLDSQNFRIMKTINNIQQEGRQTLSDNNRQALVFLANDCEKLSKTGKVNWSVVKKTINATKLNYSSEDDKKDGFVGNRTKQYICAIIGEEKWTSLGTISQQELVKELITINNKLGLYNRLIKHWKFSDGQNGHALQLSMLDLEPGYMKFSSAVIKNLLPHLAKGCKEYDALKKAGYLEDEDSSRSATNSLSVEDIPYVANPRVDRALNALRRIVNAVIRKFGKPSEIRIEMARELKSSKKHREEIKKDQDNNRERNEKADAEILELVKSTSDIDLSSLFPESPGNKYIPRKAREKYKMWKFEQRTKCVYCGNNISVAQFFCDAEIDHIIPQSSFRQNYMNTVVAHRQCNQEKRNRTPYEWKRADNDGWEIFIRKVNELSDMPVPKRNRLISTRTDHLTDEQFCSRALTDTQYIATLGSGLLKRLGVPVTPSRGQATAALRKFWKLDDILPNDPNNNFKQNEEGILVYDRKQVKQMKNRRDHRHHAIDAFIVAMTDRTTLMNLIQINQLKYEIGNEPNYENKHALIEKKNRIRNKCQSPPKWDGYLHNSVRNLVMNVVVPHQIHRRIRGSLHQEFFYGRSHYCKNLGDSTKGKKDVKLIKDIKSLLYYKPDDKGKLDLDGKLSWIPDKDARSLVQNWLNNSENNFSEKLPDNLCNIEVRYRSYVRRIPIEKAIRYAAKDWKPGTKKWIGSSSLHEDLKNWLSKHGIKEGKSSDKEIQTAINLDPPRTRSTKGKGNLIQKVRIMEIFNNHSVETIRDFQTVKLGNNHHLEIFKSLNGHQCRCVTMFEAAKRMQIKISIVDKTPDPEWEGDWEYYMTLSVNEMVEFEPSFKLLTQEHKSLGKSIFRIQKISDSGKKVDIAFRHFSVSSSENNNFGLIRVTSLTHLDSCRKIGLDILGYY